jgi:phosphoribosylanthranilate isomerase
MTFVKICGIMDKETLLAAHSADAVGFVVNSPKSHRDLMHADANKLARVAGPFQTAVAVTAERETKELHAIVRDVRPQALQVPFRAGQAAFASLHEAFPMLRLIVSCRPEDAHLVPDIADALVLDAATLDGYGGTGQRKDWNTAKVARQSASVPVILAGGLTPEIVADAVRIVEPYGVDVSSGVETDKVKDPAKIAAFIANAKGAKTAKSAKGDAP